MTRQRVLLSLLFAAVLSLAQRASAQRPASGATIELSGSVIFVDASEPSYVQYGASDLGRYLQEISGKPVQLANSLPAQNKSTLIAIGDKAAVQVGAPTLASYQAGEEVSIIRTLDNRRQPTIVIAGTSPHATNQAIASFIRMISAREHSPFVEAPLNRREVPSFRARGIHLNGWPLRYPYAFRAWKEEDWKRFVDIAWVQHINLFYLWPFMEIIPVPLSGEDRQYLEEVKRVVDYAQKERGMEVWIMQSANRIGISDCGSPDPRLRQYWVNGCQKDMNPADPQQYQAILRSFETLYSIVNNADAYCMIDSDPGGWPQSPLSDQVKIFNGAKELPPRHPVHGAKTKLVDWMHVGWGRHKYFTSTESVVGAYDWTDKNPDASDVAFMDETIRKFKAHLVEPWDLIAGMPPYLSVVQKEGVLGKTVYLPYGAIENEPAFPATNMGQEAVRKVFDKALQYRGLRGVMGNNQLMLLQFPRTSYFFATAWDRQYEQLPERHVIEDLAQRIYPDQRRLIADAFFALNETDPNRIQATLSELRQVLQAGSIGRLGAIGRYLFPGGSAVANNLRMQLEIRFARQQLVEALKGQPTPAECANLVGNYFDKLLAWNKETGWDKMIDITVWKDPIYEDGKDLQQAMYHLKQILSNGRPYTSYHTIDSFFGDIANRLVQKYGEDSVMIGCVEPLKMEVVRQ